MEQEMEKIFSWEKENVDRVIKKIDSTFLQYGETAIPKDFEWFFLDQELTIGESKKLVLIYNEKEYGGAVRRTKPRGQLKIRINKELQNILYENPMFEDGAYLQFDNRDIDEYEVSVLPAETETNVLEDESDLEELRYNGVEPIFKSVSVTKKDFSVFELLRKFKKGKLILTAEFQRKEVWKSKQKCELVESVLMGLPLPVFYLKQVNDNYIVVDGKQRFSALFEYIQDGFPLKGLKVLTELNGRKFSQLTEEYAIYQTQLEDYQVYSHVIQPSTPDAILFDIFDRVNRGGTKLNKMEIRNALYHGKGLDMLADVAKSEAFEQATSINPEKDSRMRGAYLMTRSASYNLYFMNKLKKNGEAYVLTADIDELQGIALNYLNNQPKEFLDEYRKRTIDDLIRIYEILGPTAFRRDFEPDKPINMNMFETLMYLMMIVRGREFKFDGEDLKEEVRKAITDEKYAENIGARQDSLQKITARFTTMDLLAERICK